LENSNDTLLLQANQEELSRFEQIYQLTTEPSFFLFQYDTDIVRMACQAKIDELINPKKSCVLDCSLIQTDNLLVEISKVIKENTCDLVHIINIEQAIAKYPAFLLKLNTERETVFRDLPAHIVFWTNQFGTNTLQKEAFDFWSWIVFIFIVSTAKEFLTERQKGFTNKLELENNYSFEITSKDAKSRLEELDRQWNIINKFIGTPTIKELKDCFSISQLYAIELSDNAEYIKAVAVLLKAIQLLENTTLSTEFDTLLNQLALIYRDFGKLEEAKKLLVQVLGNSIKKFGDSKSLVNTYKSNLALVLYDLGDLLEAKNLLEKVLESDTKNLGELHPTVSIHQSNLATVYRGLGNLIGAKFLLEKALGNDIKNLGFLHPNIAIRQSNLAVVENDLGNLQEAKNLLEQALKCDIENFGNFHPRIAYSQANLAKVHLDLGNLHDSKDLLEKAYSINKKVFGEKTPQTISIKKSLNQLLKTIETKGI
jgi:tetratricopeptide (TPR) repeat protein